VALKAQLDAKEQALKVERQNYAMFTPFIREQAATRIKAEQEIERLLGALREVERHCPCGARPETLNSHPHVGGCPVGAALAGPEGT